MDFGRYAATGNAFVREVARALGIEHDTERAGRMLCCVLQALRDRMTPDASLRLVSQLPEFLKGLYVEGWRFQLAAPRSRRDVDDFVAKVLHVDGCEASADFGPLPVARRRVKVVMGVLKRSILDGEGAERPGSLVLPREVEALWEAA